MEGGIFARMAQKKDQGSTADNSKVIQAEVPGNAEEKEHAEQPSETNEKVQQTVVPEPAPAAQVSGGGTAQRALSDTERITEAEKFRNREETNPVDHPAGYQNPVGGYKPPESSEKGIISLDGRTLARQEDLVTVIQVLSKQIKDLSVKLAPVCTPVKAEYPKLTSYTRVPCDEENTSEVRRIRTAVLNNTLDNLDALNKLSLELSIISDTLDI